MRLALCCLAVNPFSGWAGDLTGVKSWTYQLQSIEIDDLAADPTTDLIVMDYAKYGNEETEYSRSEIQTLKDAGKKVLAYFSIGEAEDYRFYWQNRWSNDNLKPEFLGPENAIWKGNFLVKYWDGQWKDIVFRYLERIAEAGFDGVYLDRVDSYYDWQQSGIESVSPQLEMIFFVSQIRSWAHSLSDENFVICIQNGETVIDEPGIEERHINLFLDSVDAVATEDLFFFGDLAMNNAFNPETYRFEVLSHFTERDIPVLSVEYLSQKSKQEQFVEEAKKLGFIPLVAVRDLDTMPQGLKVIENLQLNKLGFLQFQPQEGRAYRIMTRSQLNSSPQPLSGWLGGLPTLTPHIHPISTTNSSSFFTLEVDFFAE